MKKLYFARIVSEVCFVADETQVLNQVAVEALQEEIAEKASLPSDMKIVEIHATRQLPSIWLGAFPRFDTCERTCKRFLEGQK